MPLGGAGDEEDHGEDSDHDERDFDPALWVASGDGGGVAIDHHLKGFALIRVGEEPHGHEDVLEGLRGVVGVDLEIAVGVAGHLCAAQTLKFPVHPLSGEVC